MGIYGKESHNPYFNRWFSAIKANSAIINHDGSHNPYFNRWFSAISKMHLEAMPDEDSHNPYFNRWFSAI